MMQQISLALVTCGAIAGIFHGLAAMMNAWFNGRSKLIRAQRGDPELPARVLPTPAIRRLRREEKD
jgi:hypothetical protein